MGRPREHNLQTRLELIAAAERIVADGGPGALSVRTVAGAAQTSPRAVYSLFGSKEGLVDALAQRAFELIDQALDELPYTDDPVADLVEVGATVIRGFVIQHPSLHRIAFQRVVPGLRAGPELSEAHDRAHARLEARIRRLKDAGLLEDRTVAEAAFEFNAMCEGLANNELRGHLFRSLPPEGDADRAWRDALHTVLAGLGIPAHARVAPTRR